MGYIRTNTLGILGNYPRNASSLLYYIKTIANGYNSNYDSSNVTPSLLISDSSNGTFNPYHIKSRLSGSIFEYEKNYIGEEIIPAKIHFLIDETPNYNEMQSWIYEVGDYAYFFYADGEYEGYLKKLPSFFCGARYNEDYNIVTITINEENKTATLNKIFDSNVKAAVGINDYYNDMFSVAYDSSKKCAYTITGDWSDSWNLITSSKTEEGETHVVTGLDDFNVVHGSGIFRTHCDDVSFYDSVCAAFYYSIDNKYIYVLLYNYYPRVYKWVKIDLATAGQTLLESDEYAYGKYEDFPEDITGGDIIFNNEEFDEEFIGDRKTELYHTSPNKNELIRIFKMEIDTRPSYYRTEVGEYLGNGIFIIATKEYIFKSTDYGLTWKKVYTFQIPTTSLYGSISFSNGIMMIRHIYKDPQVYFHRYDGWITIFRTTDYGESWSQIVPLKNDMNTWVDRYCDDVFGAFSGNENGLVYMMGCLNLYYDDPLEIYECGGTCVWRSTDYGNSWEPLHIPHNFPFCADRSPSYSPEYIATCAVSPSGNALFGGNTWSGTYFQDYVYESDGTEYNIDPNSRQGILSLYYANDTTLLALQGSYNRIIRSTDGGKTWNMSGQLWDGIYVYRRSGNDILGANYSCSNIYKTSDDGLTWESILAQSGAYDLRSTWIAASENGVYLTRKNDTNALYRSNDYGETWEEVTIFPYEVHETTYYLNGFENDDIISYTAEKTDGEETTYYQDTDYTFVFTEYSSYSGWHPDYVKHNNDWENPIPIIRVDGYSYFLVLKNGRDEDGNETQSLGFLDIDSKEFISSGRGIPDYGDLKIYISPDNTFALIDTNHSLPTMVFKSGTFSDTVYQHMYEAVADEFGSAVYLDICRLGTGDNIIVKYSLNSQLEYACTYDDFAYLSQDKLYSNNYLGFYVYDYGRIGKLMLTDFDEEDTAEDFYLDSLDGFSGKAWVEWYTISDMLGAGNLFGVRSTIQEDDPENYVDLEEYTIKDEEIMANTAEPVTLSNDNIILIEIWTGKNKTGTQLICSTDYELGDYNSSYGTYNSITFLTHNEETVYCTYVPWEQEGYISGYKIDTTLKCAVLNKKNLTVSTYDTEKVFSRDYCFSNAYWRYYQTYKSLVFPNGNFDIKYLEDLLESIEIEDNFTCGAPIELGSYMNILNGSHMEVDNKIYNIGNYSYPLLEVPEDSIEWYFIRIDSDTTAVVYFDADKNIFGKDITGTSIQDISNVENIQYVAQGDSADFLIANSLPTVGFNINSRYAIIPLWDKKTFEGISNSMTQCYVYDKNYKSIISGGLFYSKMQNKTYYKPQIGLLGGSYNNEKDAVIINCYSNNEVSLDEPNIKSNFYPPIILSGVVDGTFKQDTGTITSYNIGEIAPYADKILFELPSDLEEEFKENSGIFGRVPAYFGLKGRAYLKSLNKNYISGILEIIDGEESGNTFEHYLRNKSILNSESGIFLQKMDDERMSYYRHYIKMYLEIFSAFYLFESNIYGYSGNLELNIRATTTPNIWRYDSFYYNLPRHRSLVTSTNKNYVDFRHYYDPIRHTIYDMWYDKDRNYDEKYSEHVEDLIDTPILDLHDIDEDSLSWGIKKLVSTPEDCLFIFNGMKDIFDEEKQELKRALFDSLFKIYLLDGKDTAEKIFSNFNNKYSYTIYDVVYNQLYNYYITDAHKTYLPNLNSEKYVTRKFAKMYNLFNTYLYWDKKFKI